jgi:hypothetical protein
MQLRRETNNGRTTSLRNVGMSLPISELIILAILPTERTQGNTRVEISYLIYTLHLVVASKETGLEMLIKLST